MRDWLTYLAWKLRGRGLVRLHIPGAPTVEGLLVGCKGGHYLVLAPSLLEESGHSTAVNGSLRIPRERVLYIQHLG